jgi:hypothetical protein
MSKIGYVQYTAIMSALLAVTILFNNCSEDANFSMSEEAINNDVFGFEEGIDPFPPSTPRIIINENAEFTKDREVNLTLDSGRQAEEMLVSNKSDCSTGRWEPFQKNRPWLLDRKNQEVAVYVKYRKDGDEETDCVQDSIIHDDIPPQVRFVSQLAEWITNRSLNLVFEAEDSGSGVDYTECITKEGGDYQACANFNFYPSLIENQPYLHIVRARDKAGNLSDPIQTNWRSDRTPPTISFNLTPAAITADTQPLFSYTATDSGSGVAGYQCSLDGAPYGSCGSTQQYSGLVDGSHNFQVRAVDNVGLMSEPLQYTWVQDSTAPTIKFTQTPNSITNSNTASFAFDGIDTNQGIVRYTCQLDSGSMVNCTSPRMLSNLPAGNHRFTVIGYDAANLASSPISFQWSIDTGAPTIRFVETPEAITMSQDARFVFSAQDNAGGAGISHIVCILDGQMIDPCPSSKDFSGLSAGSHTLIARAIDRVGNASNNISHSWLIDNTRPTVTITSTPTNPTAMTDARFQFTANDNGGSGIERIECRVDGGQFAACTSPSDFGGLSNGQHIFTVRAFDRAGNQSQNSSFEWYVDLEPPMISFVIAPDPSVFVGIDAEIRFVGNDGDGSGVSSYSCMLNGQNYPCMVDQDIIIPSLSVSNNTFVVTAVDGVGNSATIDVSWTTSFKTMPKVALFDIQPDRPVDILFIIDTSGSMDTERASLAQRFNGFLDKVKDLDWQIGVITTDAYGSSRHEAGRIAPLNGLSDKYILDPSYNLAEAQQIFGNTVQNLELTPGRHTEEGILSLDKALKRAVDPAQSPGDAPNRMLIRDGADLAAVVLSDEDEHNDGNISKVVVSPQEMLANVSTYFGGQKNFTFHSIIIKPNDTACFSSQRSETSSATYGAVYNQLSELTGAGTIGGAIVGSVCEQDYTSQLSDIGQSVKDMQKSATFECEPVDTNNDGLPDVSLRFKGPNDSGFSDFSAPHQVQGLKIIFDEFLPVGEFRMNYSCVDPNV